MPLLQIISCLAWSQRHYQVNNSSAIEIKHPVDGTGTITRFTCCDVAGKMASIGSRKSSFYWPLPAGNLLDCAKYGQRRIEFERQYTCRLSSAMKIIFSGCTLTTLARNRCVAQAMSRKSTIYPHHNPHRVYPAATQAAECNASTWHDSSMRNCWIHSK